MFIPKIRLLAPPTMHILHVSMILHVKAGLNFKTDAEVPEKGFIFLFGLEFEKKKIGLNIVTCIIFFLQKLH